MGRAPCCAKVGLHRGPWTPREDTLLTHYIQAHGEGNWRSLPKKAGLLRCGKSCRLRWMNYLRPDIKRGNITPDEDDLIIRLHTLLGNRWSLIAGRLPGRTDNEIKNYWNTHLSKRLRSQGTDPNTHKKLSDPDPALRRGSAAQRRNNKATRKKKNNKDNNNNNKNNTNNKQIVHLPKPIRVRRNYSFEWINNGTNSTNDNNNNINNNNNACGSSSQEKGSTTSSSNDQEVDVPWFKVATSTSDHDHEYYDYHHDDHNELGFLINSNIVDHHNNVNHDLDHHDLESRGDSIALENMYEEYLAQLLKTSDHQGYDHDQLELDSFAESLLI